MLTQKDAYARLMHRQRTKTKMPRTHLNNSTSKLDTFDGKSIATAHILPCLLVEHAPFVGAIDAPPNFLRK